MKLTKLSTLFGKTADNALGLVDKVVLMETKSVSYSSTIYNRAVDSV